MAGRGRPPKENRQNPRDVPIRGEWKVTDRVGWQHGEAPRCPSGLTTAARTAWRVWFAAWFAAYWTPDDLPGLRQLIRLYDQVERGEFHRAGELRLQMDTYGITPKGQQDRRWKPPAPPTRTDAPAPPTAIAPTGTTGAYGHLRAID